MGIDIISVFNPPMEMEIMTCNSMYENGECVGGYHEFHKVKFLSGTKHAIATIESIIKNNLLYGCKVTILESVSISCVDQRLVDAINDYFSDSKIEISAFYLDAVNGKI